MTGTVIVNSGCSAVGSAPALGAGCREFESLHSDHIYGSIAQLGEHLPYKQGVTGSSPVVPTKKEVTFVRQKLLLFLSKP